MDKGKKCQKSEKGAYDHPGQQNRPKTAENLAEFVWVFV